MIEIKHLSVGSRLAPLSLTVKAGEVVHVIGPNGSGKSTLLAAIAGLLDFSGEVNIDGNAVSSASVETLAQWRAFLAQSDRPAFNLEVIHYLSLSLPNHLAAQSWRQRISAKNSLPDFEQVTDTINQLAQLLEIDDKLHRSIHHLSGGEWQRVRLCAICLQIWPTLNPYAQLLILDEPAAPLDIGQESLLYKLIDKVAKMGIAVVMSNHDLNRTLQYADKALLLENGVLQSVGEVEKVLSVSELSRVFRTEVKQAFVEGSPVLLFD